MFFFYKLDELDSHNKSKKHLKKVQTLTRKTRDQTKPSTNIAVLDQPVTEIRGQKQSDFNKTASLEAAVSNDAKTKVKDLIQKTEPILKIAIPDHPVTEIRAQKQSDSNKTSSLEAAVSNDAKTKVKDQILKTEPTTKISVPDHRVTEIQGQKQKQSDSNTTAILEAAVSNDAKIKVKDQIKKFETTTKIAVPDQPTVTKIRGQKRKQSDSNETASLEAAISNNDKTKVKDQIQKTEPTTKIAVSDQPVTKIQGQKQKQSDYNKTASLEAAVSDNTKTKVKDQTQKTEPKAKKIKLVCYVCLKSYINVEGLRSHIAKKHPTEENLQNVSVSQRLIRVEILSKENKKDIDFNKNIRKANISIKQAATIDQKKSKCYSHWWIKL